MDVGVITKDTWEGIHNLVTVLWLVLPLAVILGGSLLLSLAVNPSLVSTGELPQRTERLRLPLYAVALISGVALIAVLVATALAAGIIGDFWPRWLI